MQTKRLAVLLVGAATWLASACAMQGADDGDESLGEIQAAVSYDTAMVKPVPKSFLTKKLLANECCVGFNAFAGCGTPCADAKGLITQAGYDKGSDYYRATGQDTLDTLDKWKGYYKFPKQLPGELTETFRKRTDVVVYYNRTELALGRELGCAQDGATSIACYVTNYGDAFGSVHNLLTPDADTRTGLEYARQGYAQPKNTVVISYDTRREAVQGDGTAVQFAAFGPDGKRIQKAQLDEQGARPIPQVCMTCHGGVWDADARAANGFSVMFQGAYYGVARFARFLPLITSTVTFSGVAPYTLTDQQPAIKAVNQAAWRARGTGLTTRQRFLMGYLYNASVVGEGVALNLKRSAMMVDTLDWHSSTPGRQYAENAWPGGWSASQAVYNGVVLPYCDTCHLAMDPSANWRDLAGNAIAASATRKVQAGIAFDGLRSVANATAVQTKTMLMAQMGVTTNASGLGIFTTDRNGLTMPHSEQAFERFWGDNTGAGGFKCTLWGKKLPPGDCLMYELGIWPSGRADPKTAQNPTGIDWAALAPTTDLECGQSTKTPVVSNGVNAGRRLASAALPAPLDATYINQCGDGCRSGAYCPGSETASQANPFPGARQECVPIIAGGVLGNCVSCGRIGERACTQVGASCDTTLNPNCKNLAACHEGTNQGGWCGTTDLSHNGSATPSQSSVDYGGSATRAIDGNYSGIWADNSVTHTNGTTDAAPWWKIDLAWTRKVKNINLFNRVDCCTNRLGNFVLESSTDNVSWTAVPNGDFTGVFPSTSNYIPVTIPKAIDARYIRVRMLAGGPPGENFRVLSLAEVSVLGWN